MTKEEAYSKGLYLLTTWAVAGDVSPALVRQNFLASHGRDRIEALGRLSVNLNFGKIQDAFRETISDGASKENPTPADLNSSLLVMAGQGPTVLELVEGVGSDIWAKVNLGAGLFLIGTAVYFLIASGVFATVVSEAKKARG